ncbi:MAG TPA: hypothetical protein VGM23_16405, partial [Armatimonadota bacterium]
MAEHGLSFADSTANMGVKDLGVRLTVEGTETIIRYRSVRQTGDGLTAEGDTGNGLVVKTTVTPVDGLRAVVLEHQIINTSARPVWINAVATGLFAPSASVLPGLGHGLGWDLRYCHTDLVRSERYPHCQVEYPYVRMLPTETVRLGRGEDQAFPALGLLDLQGRRSLVFAAVSQALHYTVFTLRKTAFTTEGMLDLFAIEHDPGQTQGFGVPAGGALTLDGVFIQIVDTVSAEDIFVDYVNYAASRQPLRGATTPLRTQALHCTWNYGVFDDQSEASLLPTARFIAEHLPNIKFFLMDAGYLTGDSGTTFLDRLYPDPHQHVTADKWPRGIRGFTEELRRLGLRPGLWWSPTVR